MYFIYLLVYVFSYTDDSLNCLQGVQNCPNVLIENVWEVFVYVSNEIFVNLYFVRSRATVRRHLLKTNIRDAQ